MNRELSKISSWIASQFADGSGPPTQMAYSSSPVWIICLISTLFAIAVTVSTGVHIAWSGFMAPIGINVGLAAIYWAIRLGKRTPELETAPGALAAICWSGLMALIATHAGLRADNPLIDDALARWDSLLGSAPRG